MSDFLHWLTYISFYIVSMCNYFTVPLIANFNLIFHLMIIKSLVNFSKEAAFCIYTSWFK